MNGGVNQQVDQAIEWIRSGKVEKGLTILKQLMKQSAQNPDLLFQLAETFYELGHLDTAKALLDGIEPFFDELATEGQLDIQMLRVEILIDQGELDQAINEIHDCLEREPDFIQAMLLLADIYLMQELPEIACHHLENILEIDPEQDEIRLTLAQLYLDLGDVKRAGYHFDELKDSPIQSGAILGKAKLLSQVGDFEQAYELFKACLECDRSTEVLYGCSLTAYQLERLDEALSFGLEVLHNEPEYMGAYLLLGQIYEKMGNFQSAIDKLEEALSVQDQDETILLKLVELTYENGQVDQAQRYLNQLLELDDEHELALEWVERLRVGS